MIKAIKRLSERLMPLNIPRNISGFMQFISPRGRGTVVLIVSCRCAYCLPETTHGKITRYYSRICAVAFCYVHKYELPYIYPRHDVKLHPHRVKL